MKQYKKIVPVIGLICILSCVNICYATETDALQVTKEESTSNDSTESLEESFGSEKNPEDVFSKYTEIGMVDENGNTLVFINSDRHIFYDETYDLYYDENGTVSREEVAKLGIIADEGTIVETLPEAKTVQLNISVDFFSFLIFSLALSNIDLLLVSLKTSLNDLFLASTCDLLNKSSIFKVSFLLSALLLTSLKLICFFS